MQSPAHCVACGSTELTPLTMFSPDEGSARLTWNASGKMFTAVVHRARACLACGHVALALEAKQLEKVRAVATTLTPF